ncbi:hypothetical protein LGH70_07895 [Hymenobacter sp. BT635]|uniref:STAS/SEC14 domain-containing protein n=1 Tax=Hymenobacter nitidus TaxID=2880929 RepID=A0ABS8AER4_9BACT|nr:hypothetical protein [Hymenobacter nitidus]MCB2377499.1 hypothetical protein [Hymenobacter nitidus]
MDTETDNPALWVLGTTSALTVYYDTANRWLYTDWQGSFELTTARQSAQLLVECLREYPCHKLLNSTLRVTSSWHGQEQWAGETLFPLLAQHGIRYMACVYSVYWPARYSLDSTLGFAAQPFVASFDDLATACAWLLQAH